ncbi:MAG: DUF975 family protein [Bacillota bacterium]
MEKSIQDLKKIARRQLGSNGLANTILTVTIVGVPIVSYLIFGTYSIIIIAVLLAPMLLGFGTYYLRLVRAYKAPYSRDPKTDYTIITPYYMKYSTSNPNVFNLSASTIFYGFKYFFTAAGMLLWYLIWILLWSSLLVVPGIIKSYSYRLCFLILADNPEIGIRKSMKLSEKMMNGHRFKLFLLDISFIGWILLSLITLLLGTAITIPYIMATNAVFYEELKKHCINSNTIEENEIVSKKHWDY